MGEELVRLLQKQDALVSHLYAELTACTADMARLKVGPAPSPRQPMSKKGQREGWQEKSLAVEREQGREMDELRTELQQLTRAVSPRHLSKVQQGLRNMSK